MIINKKTIEDHSKKLAKVEWDMVTIEYALLCFNLAYKSWAWKRNKGENTSKWLYKVADFLVANLLRPTSECHSPTYQHCSLYSFFERDCFVYFPNAWDHHLSECFNRKDTCIFIMKMKQCSVGGRGTGSINPTGHSHEGSTLEALLLYQRTTCLFCRLFIIYPRPWVKVMVALHTKKGMFTPFNKPTHTTSVMEYKNSVCVPWDDKQKQLPRWSF